MKKYNAIDLSKFILSFFVIAIHTNPSTNLSSGGGIAAQCYETIIRIAVPLFFMFAGYLVFMKKPDERKIKQYAFKILKLYFIWSVIYLPLSIYHFVHTGITLWRSICLYLYNFIVIGEQWYSYPLWYLLSTFYSVVVIIILGRIFQKFKYKSFLILMIAMIVFIVVYAITGQLYAGYGRILTGFFYLSVGMYFAQFDRGVLSSKKAKFILYIICFVGFITDILMANLISKWILYISLFLIIVESDHFPDSKRWISLRKASAIIYFLHMYVFFAITVLKGEEFRYGWDSFLICSLICTVISACLLSNERIYKSKTFKLLFG